MGRKALNCVASDETCKTEALKNKGLAIALDSSCS